MGKNIIVSYTTRGPKFYVNPANVVKGLTCDLNDSLHLALSVDGGEFTPPAQRHRHPVPRAEFDNDLPAGRTKTLVDPWLFRMQDGRFGVCAVRRNQNEPDDTRPGSVMIFTSDNLIRYDGPVFLKLGTAEIRHLRCAWDEDERRYRLEWEDNGVAYCGHTRFFKAVDSTTECATPRLSVDSTPDIADAVIGGALEISDEEARRLRDALGVIANDAVAVDPVSTRAGEAVDFDDLPQAVCHYTDGSTHRKNVRWDRSDYDAIDWTCPGDYTVAVRCCSGSGRSPSIPTASSPTRSSSSTTVAI